MTSHLIPHSDVQIHFHSQVSNLILPASFLGYDLMGSSPKRMKAFNTSPFNSVPFWILTCLCRSMNLTKDVVVLFLLLVKINPSIQWDTFDFTLLPSLGPYFLNYSLCHKSSISISPFDTATICWSHKWTNLPFTFVPIWAATLSHSCSLQTSGKMFHLLSILQCSFSFQKSSPPDLCLSPPVLPQRVYLSHWSCCGNHHVWENAIVLSKSISSTPSSSNLL